LFFKTHPKDSISSSLSRRPIFFFKSIFQNSLIPELLTSSAHSGDGTDCTLPARDSLRTSIGHTLLRPDEPDFWLVLIRLLPFWSASEPPLAPPASVWQQNAALDKLALPFLPNHGTARIRPDSSQNHTSLKLIRSIFSACMFYFSWYQG